MTDTHLSLTPQESFAAALSHLDKDDKESISSSISLLSALLSQSSSKHSSFLDDISTPSLEFLTVPFHLGRAHLKMPCPSSTHPIDSSRRKQNVLQSMNYFDLFLKRIEDISDLFPEPDFSRDLSFVLGLIGWSDDDNAMAKWNTGQIREIKIRRHERKKQAQREIARLEGLVERRARLGIYEEDDFEGFDWDSLSRDLFAERLRFHAEESLEELQSSKTELEMLDMAIQMETMRAGDNEKSSAIEDRMMHTSLNSTENHHSSSSAVFKPSEPRPPLQMTQITQNPSTGKLSLTKQQISNGTIKTISSTPAAFIQQPYRQQIASTVFQPGWNLPTMSLEELAEIELKDAIARSQSQKEEDSRNRFRPRRYDELKRDGMEDDEDLVEKSADLDRRWDVWKEDNPRGSGNKMGERGDRNF